MVKNEIKSKISKSIVISFSFVILIALIAYNIIYFAIVIPGLGMNTYFGKYQFLMRKNADTDEIVRLGMKTVNKETLILPTVSKRGYIITSVRGNDSLYNNGGLKSNKTKNLYVNSNITLKEKSIEKLTSLENIYISSLSTKTITEVSKKINQDCNLYIPSTEYISVSSSIKSSDLKYIKIANVVYYNNYSEAKNEVFLVDYCSNTLTNVTPDNPYREGYKFLGWYKEEECNNKWDFKKDIVESPIYDIDGIHILNETKLYAKWEKE